MGVMESIYTELALYGSKNECAGTDTAFLPLSEVCNGMVSLGKICGDPPTNPSPPSDPSSVSLLSAFFRVWGPHMEFVTDARTLSV